MIVCVCNRISDRDILQAIEGGAQSMEALQTKLEIANQCGACFSTAEDLLRQQLQDISPDSGLFYAA